MDTDTGTLPSGGTRAGLFTVMRETCKACSTLLAAADAVQRQHHVLRLEIDGDGEDITDLQLMRRTDSRGTSASIVCYRRWSGEYLSFTRLTHCATALHSPSLVVVHPGLQGS